MEKPDVRILELQKEEIKDNYVSDYEKNNLLAKYGYKVDDLNQNKTNKITDNLTFDEMIELEEIRLRDQNKRKEKKQYTPMPYSFDQVNYADSKYSSIDLDGTNIGFEVTIMSDMPINQRKY